MHKLFQNWHTWEVVPDNTLLKHTNLVLHSDLCVLEFFVGSTPSEFKKYPQILSTSRPWSAAMACHLGGQLLCEEIT